MVGKRCRAVLRVVGVALAVLAAQAATAQTASAPLIPHPTWDCGMPEGSPAPETGTLVFEIEIPLEKTDVRVAELKLVWIPTG